MWTLPSPIPMFGSLVVEIETRVLAVAGTDMISTATVRGGNDLDGSSVPHDEVVAAGTSMNDTVEVTVRGGGDLVQTGSSPLLLLLLACALLIVGGGLRAVRRPVRRSA